MDTAFTNNPEREGEKKKKSGGNSMAEFMILIIIGIIAGIGLSLFMELVRMLTGNPASILLYNLDYMPVLKKWNHVRGIGLLFHFVTCIASVVVLFYLLQLISWEYYIF